MWAFHPGPVHRSYNSAGFCFALGLCWVSSLASLWERQKGWGRFTRKNTASLLCVCVLLSEFWLLSEDVARGSYWKAGWQWRVKARDGLIGLNGFRDAVDLKVENPADLPGLERKRRLRVLVVEKYFESPVVGFSINAINQLKLNE